MMNKEAETNRELWEQRSSEHQNELKGVLFKRFPESLNQHIHQAHLSFVLDNITSDSQRILDAGCGYGRISMEILKKFPQADISGLDVSDTYVELYKKNTGHNAFQGNLGSLPEAIGKYNLIVCVAVLMYVPKEEVEQTLRELLDHTNENGKIILIEPLQSGKFFSSGFGLLNLVSKDKSKTAGNCFTAKDLKRKIRECGGNIIKEKRTPFTTLFIIPIYLLARIFKHMSWVYKCTNRWDRWFGGWHLPSLHTFLIIEKG
jgi:2-polyprenyl-3-methyl-5-hydroxy-6-metoxy-1,4-benzoquinol methylase